MSRISRVAGIGAAVAVWVGMVVLMGLDHAPADGATVHDRAEGVSASRSRSGPCVGHGERSGFVPETPRAVVERAAGVVGAGVRVRKLDDQLVHGVAYLTCSGKRFVVLYFNDGEVVASVIVA